MARFAFMIRRVRYKDGFWCASVGCSSWCASSDSNSIFPDALVSDDGACMQVECTDGRRVCPCGQGMAEIPWPPGLPSLPLASILLWLFQIGEAIPVLQAFDTLSYAVANSCACSYCYRVCHLATEVLRKSCVITG